VPLFCGSEGLQPWQYYNLSGGLRVGSALVKKRDDRGLGGRASLVPRPDLAWTSAVVEPSAGAPLAEQRRGAPDRDQRGEAAGAVLYSLMMKSAVLRPASF
jgi:hypothetical protein